MCAGSIVPGVTEYAHGYRGIPEALFDPREPADIARLLTKVLTNPNFAARLRAHGIARGKSFTWDAVAVRTIDALET